jgi:hypothetical protein
MQLGVVDWQRARATFEQALVRTPARAHALEGLLQAEAYAGETGRQQALRARLDAIRRFADRRAP